MTLIVEEPWLKAKENTVTGKAIAAKDAKKSLLSFENRLFSSSKLNSASEEPRKQIATDLHPRAHLSPALRKTYIRLAEVADALGKDMFEKGLVVRCRVPHTIIAICNGLLD
jgi:hypothetical protein